MLSTGILIDGARYKIEALISSGVSSDIYRASDLVLNEAVAIKVFKRVRLSAKAVPQSTKFTREVKSLSQLSHSNIVTIYKCGYLEEGNAFMVEELLTGQTLKAYLNRENHLNCNEAVSIALEIASALAYAHKQGILHLDLKPENVMLLKQDEGSTTVKILDFAMSKAQASAEDLDTTIGEPEQETTEAGSRYHRSLAFMSPEQCKNEEPDGRSDIYSFGCLLFFLLTGRPPFESHIPAEVLMMHIHQRMPQILKLAPGCGLPKSLDQLMARCTAKDREARYRSFDEIIPILESVASLNSQARYSSIAAESETSGYFRPVAVSVLALLVAGATYWAVYTGVSFTVLKQFGLTRANSRTASDELEAAADSIKRELVVSRNSKLASEKMRSVLNSLSYESVPAKIRTEFLEKQKSLFEQFGDNATVSQVYPKLIKSLMQEALESPKNAPMNEPWQGRMIDTCHKLGSGKYSSSVWEHINVLFATQRPKLLAAAGNAAGDIIELEGYANFRQQHVPSGSDLKHASQSFMEAALWAKENHRDNLFEREINLALDICKSGNVNQVAIPLHLLIAENAYDKKQFAQSRKELQQALDLAKNITLHKADEDRIMALQAKLKQH